MPESLKEDATGEVMVTKPLVKQLVSVYEVYWLGNIFILSPQEDKNI
jgi:hypothetical protein